MIKDGKVICIKTVLSFDKTKVLLEEGQIYTAKFYGKEDGYGYVMIFGVEFYSDIQPRVYFPYSSRHNEIKYSEIKDCLISLAELREQQIKTIL
jgi:hypothetical protein